VQSGHPCHPSFCSVFHLGPCFPYYLPPIGQDLRLTIVSTDDDARENATHGADANAEQTAGDRKLDSIRDMFAALRACWVPPAKDEARHGVEYTSRFAFKRDGEVVAPPRMTYASHDAPAAVRDTCRDSIDAVLHRSTSATAWPERSPAAQSPSASSTSARPIRTAGSNPAFCGSLPFSARPCRVPPLIPAKAGIRY